MRAAAGTLGKLQFLRETGAAFPVPELLGERSLTALVGQVQTEGVCGAPSILPSDCAFSGAGRDPNPGSFLATRKKVLVESDKVLPPGPFLLVPDTGG